MQEKMPERQNGIMAQESSRKSHRARAIAQEPSRKSHRANVMAHEIHRSNNSLRKKECLLTSLAAAGDKAKTVNEAPAFPTPR
jgi:hypothetical protein